MEETEALSSQEDMALAHTLIDAEDTLATLAVLLALLDRFMTLVGGLAFVWATVVLLGGYVGKLTPYDFMVITSLLVMEGARLTSNINRLEIQHNALGLKDFLKLAYHHFKKPCSMFFRVSARGIDFILYVLQLSSALTSLVLSIQRLSQRNFGISSDKEDQNMGRGMLIFYSLVALESFMFLLSLICWELVLVMLLKTADRGMEKRLQDRELVPIGCQLSRECFEELYKSRAKGSTILQDYQMDFTSFTVKRCLSSDNTSQETINYLAILYSLCVQSTRSKIASSNMVLQLIGWMASRVDLRFHATKLLSNLLNDEEVRSRVVFFLYSDERNASSLLQGIADNASPQVLRKLHTDPAWEKLRELINKSLNEALIQTSRHDFFVAVMLNIMRYFSDEDTSWLHVWNAEEVYTLTRTFSRGDLQSTFYEKCGDLFLELSRHKEHIQLFIGAGNLPSRPVVAVSFCSIAIFARLAKATELDLTRKYVFPVLENVFLRQPIEHRLQILSLAFDTIMRPPFSDQQRWLHFGVIMADDLVSLMELQGLQEIAASLDDTFKLELSRRLLNSLFEAKAYAKLDVKEAIEKGKATRNNTYAYQLPDMTVLMCDLVFRIDSLLQQLWQEATFRSTLSSLGVSF